MKTISQKIKQTNGLFDIKESHIIGHTPRGLAITYQMFLENPYIVRSILKLTPAGVRVLMFARSVDPFIDVSPDTLAELSQPGRRLILKFKPLHAWGVLMITWT